MLISATKTFDRFDHMIMSRAKGHAVLVIEFVLELEVSLYQPGLEGEWL